MKIMSSSRSVRYAAALQPAVKSLADSKACIDQRKEKPDKAAEAANKALKTLPNQGLAEYCLSLLAQDKKAPREEVVKLLQAAAKGDPLSLPVWTALATQYQAANDTANTLVAFKQMLRVAPTNQKLRQELLRFLRTHSDPPKNLRVAIRHAPPLKVSEHDPYPVYYDDRLANLVGERARWFCERFD